MITCAFKFRGDILNACLNASALSTLISTAPTKLVDIKKTAVARLCVIRLIDGIITPSRICAV